MNTIAIGIGIDLILIGAVLAVFLMATRIAFHGGWTGLNLFVGTLAIITLGLKTPRLAAAWGVPAYRGGINSVLQVVAAGVFLIWIAAEVFGRWRTKEAAKDELKFGRSAEQAADMMAAAGGRVVLSR